MFFTIQTHFRYIIILSSIGNLVFDVKFQSFIVKTVFFTLQTDYRYIILFFLYRKPRFQLNILVFHCKNGVFHYTNVLSIHNTIFFSIENLVFNVKFHSLFVKAFNKNSVFHFKNGVFHYTNGFSIHNTIFFYRRPRFRCKISVLHCKKGVFHYTNEFSICNSIFFYRKPHFQTKISVFIGKIFFFLIYNRIFDL